MPRHPVGVGVACKGMQVKDKGNMRELPLAEFARRVGRMAAEGDGPDYVTWGMLGIILKHSEAFPDSPPLVRVLCDDHGRLHYELNEQRALALGFI